ncbi:MAG: reverse transcriptase-like protein [Actinobacteria bacterium]|nr:reverse transcriptase-like protein [Actinomycetota bacterium]
MLAALLAEAHDAFDQIDVVPTQASGRVTANAGVRENGEAEELLPALRPSQHLLDLGELYTDASSLVAQFASIRICWVPREMNAEADRLVKDALGALD